MERAHLKDVSRLGSGESATTCQGALEREFQIFVRTHLTPISSCPCIAAEDIGATLRCRRLWEAVRLGDICEIIGGLWSEITAPAAGKITIVHAVNAVSINLKRIARVTKKQAAAPCYGLYHDFIMQESPTGRRQRNLYLHSSENGRYAALKGRLSMIPRSPPK